MCEDAHLSFTSLYSRPFGSRIHGEEFDIAITFLRPGQRTNAKTEPLSPIGWTMAHAKPQWQAAALHLPHGGVDNCFSGSRTTC